jgi:hypothetical protein
LKSEGEVVVAFNSLYIQEEVSQIMKRSHLFRKFHRGQAMAEYHVFIPAAILVALLAGAISGFLIDSFETTKDGLQPETENCEEGDPGTNENDSQGPLSAQMSGHTITLTGKVYNEATNTTTLTYRVRSNGNPSISHWIIAMPSEVTSKIVRTSERYEIGSDPRTGVTGLKFDTGYATNTNDNSGYALVSTNRQPRMVETRDIMILLTGDFDWEAKTVAIKAGQNVYTSTITTPVRVKQENEECENPE